VTSETVGVETGRSGAGAGFLDNLQILRFVAAAMVLAHHLLLELRSPRLSAPLVDPTGVEWSTGVDVFFLVSGFIIYYLTHRRFAEPGYPVQFLRRRFIRVVPLYWLFTSVMIAVILSTGGLVAHTDLGLGRVVSSYLFWPWSRADGESYPILGLGWTLNYEMLFYVSYTAALCLPRRLALVGLGAVFVGAAIVGRFLPPSWVAVRFWTNPMILEFPLGMALAMTYLKGVRLPLWASLILVVAGLALSSVLTRLFGVGDGERLVWGGAPAVLIAAGIMLAPSPNGASWLTRVLVLCGGASYALYLTHMFTLRLLTTAWSRIGVGGPVGYLVCGFVLAIGASVAAYLWIEQPVLAYLNRTISPKRAPGRRVSGAGVG
jgi:exopolysaccharide production protein ExoZ